MLTLLNVVTILLIAASWCLITLAVRDIFVTVRMAITPVQKNNGRSFYYYSFSCWTISRTLQFINSHKELRFMRVRANILFPVLQILFWKLLLIAGFAFVYLAVDWKLRGELSDLNPVEDFFSALWLSFTISVRLAPYNITSHEMLIRLIANIQFYSGFLFYAVVFSYLLTLRRKTKQMQLCLYGIEYELKKQYSPFHFSARLKESYSSKEIIVILAKWEVWAEKLRDNLISFPPLIYSLPRTGNLSWLSSLSIILDTTTAIIVTSDGTLEQKARRTLAVSRHNLIVIANHLRIMPGGVKQVSNKELFLEYEDNVLSSEIIFDMKEERNSTTGDDMKKESNPTAGEIEMLEVWQFTYQTSLKALSDYLDDEIPSRKSNKQNC